MIGGDEEESIPFSCTLMSLLSLRSQTIRLWDPPNEIIATIAHEKNTILHQTQSQSLDDVCMSWSSVIKEREVERVPDDAVLLIV